MLICYVRLVERKLQVQMARAEVKRVSWFPFHHISPLQTGASFFDSIRSDPSLYQVQDHRDRVLSEGRREVGIWSSYGVKAVESSKLSSFGRRNKCLSFI